MVSWCNINCTFYSQQNVKQKSAVLLTAEGFQISLEGSASPVRPSRPQSLVPCRGKEERERPCA